MRAFFDPARIVLHEDPAALAGRVRWRLVPFATLNHLSLGSVFAWSMFNQPLMRLQGVVVPAAHDWTLGDVTVTFSLIMGGFAWGAVFSKHLDRMGARLCSVLGAFDRRRSSRSSNLRRFSRSCLFGLWILCCFIDRHLTFIASAICFGTDLGSGQRRGIRASHCQLDAMVP